MLVKKFQVELNKNFFTFLYIILLIITRSQPHYCNIISISYNFQELGNNENYEIKNILRNEKKKIKLGFNQSWDKFIITYFNKVFCIINHFFSDFWVF